MLMVGLTGAIGSGKSLVSSRLAALGAVVIDADLIARAVVEPGEPALDEIVERFGDRVLKSDGTLDRQELSRIVFADSDELEALNVIVHPRIAAKSAALTKTAPEDSVVVYDVPLLVENDLASRYDIVVVVDSPDELRLNRLMQMRGMTEADARARMDVQANREERLLAADFVIKNDGSLGRLNAQIDSVWNDLVTAESSSR